jgi:Kef-type K+ transport system membrane component KefB
MEHSLLSPLGTLLTQIAMIYALSRMLGWLFERMRQPRVMADIIVGLLLGPTVLGQLWPEFSAAVFAPNRLNALQAIGDLGAVLFMFIVGLKFDTAVLATRARMVFFIGQFTAVLPLLLGAALAVYLYPRMAGPGVPISGFALFVGLTIAVTAFPVLVRILEESGLVTTSLGTLSLACAAVNDLIVWSLLALVLAWVRPGGTVGMGLISVIGAAGFLATMVWVVRPMLHRYVLKRAAGPDTSRLVLALGVTLASAWVAEWLGIHALLGAFLAGAIMPREQQFSWSIVRAIEALTLVLLVPVYFAFAGLKTDLSVLSSASLGVDLVLIVVVAIAAKMGGALLAARYCGLSWPESKMLAVLVNIRGLMGVLLANIGLEAGLISPNLFSLLTLMTLITTFMAMPWLAGYASRAQQAQTI